MRDWLAGIGFTPIAFCVNATRSSMSRFGLGNRLNRLMIGSSRDRLRICSFIDASRALRSSRYHRLYVVFGNLLLLDKDQRLRLVSGMNDKAYSDAQPRERRSAEIRINQYRRRRMSA